MSATNHFSYSLDASLVVLLWPAEAAGYTVGTEELSSWPLMDNFLPPTNVIRAGGAGGTVTVSG